MDKSIFIVDPPPEFGDASYVLFVTRGGSPFGGGTGYAIFGVDGVKAELDDAGRASHFSATRDGVLVTSFPAGTPFLLVPKVQVSSYTELEYALKSKTEQAELDTALGSKPDPPGMLMEAGPMPEAALAPIHTGHYL